MTRLSDIRERVDGPKAICKCDHLKEDHPIVDCHSCLGCDNFTARGDSYQEDVLWLISRLDRAEKVIAAAKDYKAMVDAHLDREYDNPWDNVPALVLSNLLRDYDGEEIKARGGE